MALLVFVAMPFNDGFYEYWVNNDPQGDAQQHEWIYTRRLFRYTSGMRCGRLPLLAGPASPPPRSGHRAGGGGSARRAPCLMVAAPVAQPGLLLAWVARGR
jgi:hypothetical protein